MASEESKGDDAASHRSSSASGSASPASPRRRSSKRSSRSSESKKSEERPAAAAGQQAAAASADWLQLSPVEDRATRSERFASNYVRTHKYTKFNFIVLDLFNQFRRAANLYFLVIAVLQSIPLLSPLTPVTAIAPLVLVIGLSMLKDGIEDYRRYKSDQQVNARLVQVLSAVPEDKLASAEEVAAEGEPHAEGAAMVRWDGVVAGDIVRVRRGHVFPADLCLLRSSGPEGACYIETSNLDGETNLKIFSAPELTRDESTDALLAAELAVLAEAPTDDLYTFKGTLRSRLGEDLPLDERNLLLRGSSLQNTDYVDGVVVYTGSSSKIMLNATAARFKQSRLEGRMNRMVLAIFCLQCALCAMAAIISGSWVVQADTLDYSYIDLSGWFGGNPTTLGGLAYGTYTVLLNTLIPISLMVSVEFVKLGQALFINSDAAMFNSKSGRGARARTSALNEELGQVRYVFSDKTGTLTENVMNFRMCTAGMRRYTDTMEEDAALVRRRRASTSTSSIPGPSTAPAESALSALNGSAEGRSMLLALALCHTVVPEGDLEEPEAIRYNAASPDEGALVAAAAEYGCRFVDKSSTEYRVIVNGKLVTYELLDVLDFDNTRKRMSVIVRTPRGSILLITKGADSSMLPRCEGETEARKIRYAVDELKSFGLLGLRTLVVAQRELSLAEFEEWHADWRAAQASMGDREAEVRELADRMERELQLIGTTAIEDALQEGVPAAIENLTDAGISVWMLTGDKQETAIEIGYSCNLLQAAMSVALLNAATGDEYKALVDKLTQKAAKSESSTGLVIDGRTLAFALQERHQADFVHLASLCKSVIVCRCSPLQKAETVLMVKRHDPSITLSIGDGANDVSMIMQADIGDGREGTQAVRASDYSVTRFAHLSRLLLFHGSLSYYRTAGCVTYFFYKNITFTLPLLWYAIYSAWSGQPLYDDYLITLYNTIFTAGPVVVRALFEQHASSAALAAYPQLYSIGQSNSKFDNAALLTAVFNGIWQSCVCFWLPLAVRAGGGIVSPATGHTAGNWTLGVTVFSGVILTVTLKIALDTFYWCWVTFFVYGATLLLYFVAFAFVYTALPGRMLGVFTTLYNDPQFWLLMALIPIVALLPEYVYDSYSQNFGHNPLHIVRRMADIPDTPLKKRVSGSSSSSAASPPAAAGAAATLPKEDSVGDAEEVVLRVARSGSSLGSARST